MISEEVLRHDAARTLFIIQWFQRNRSKDWKLMLCPNAREIVKDMIEHGHNAPEYLEILILVESLDSPESLNIALDSSLSWLADEMNEASSVIIPSSQACYGLSPQDDAQKRHEAFIAFFNIWSLDRIRWYRRFTAFTLQNGPRYAEHVSPT